MNEHKKARSGRSGAAPSIVFRLGSRLMLRLIGIFLCFDLLLLLAVSALAVGRAERTAALVAQRLSQAGSVEEAAQWLSDAGYSVVHAQSAPRGVTLPDELYFLLPDSTEGGVRSLTLPDRTDSGALARLAGLGYVVAVSDGAGGVWLITADLSLPVRMLRVILISLLALQALALLRHTLWGSRMIRRTLRPLNELAWSAERLGTVGADLSAEDMQSMAYKLETMNAARLDTRIPVDQTQSELKTLAASINGLLDRVSEAYRAQVRFVSDASHELRTPIAVIQGYAGLLDRWGKNDPKAMQESIDAIRAEAANMQELVEKLLFLARGDANALALQPQTLELSLLAEEVVRQTRLIDPAHNYTTQLQGAYVNADEALLRQALRVLVDNARKYTPDGGNIRIAVSDGGQWVSLVVQDDGIGIPPQALPHIFDRFYRADESRARATGGNGLGLSIAKWVVDRHGGQIEVLSRQDLGTRFTILLPRTAPPAPGDEP